MIKELRQIQLDLPEPATVAISHNVNDYRFSDRFHAEDGSIVEIERYREGHELIVKQTKWYHSQSAIGTESVCKTSLSRTPAVIPIDWIAAQHEINLDLDFCSPWDDQDGWEHDYERIRQPFPGTDDDMRSMRGFVSGGSNRNDMCVTLNYDSFAGESKKERFDYFRLNGASKQVARELVARQNQKYIDQIVEWRVDGYQCYVVAVSVTLAGKTYDESLCGVDDEDYAKKEVTLELAYQIAHQLIDDGFTITGMQDRSGNYVEARRRSTIERMRHRMASFNWDDND